MRAHRSKSLQRILRDSEGRDQLIKFVTARDHDSVRETVLTLKSGKPVRVRITGVKRATG